MRQSVRVGKLNLVDLAGSERVHVTGATGAAPATCHRLILLRLACLGRPRQPVYCVDVVVLSDC